MAVQIKVWKFLFSPSDYHSPVLVSRYGSLGNSGSIFSDLAAIGGDNGAFRGSCNPQRTLCLIKHPSKNLYEEHTPNVLAVFNDFIREIHNYSLKIIFSESGSPHDLLLEASLTGLTLH